jgi:RNA-binding protein
MISKIQKKYLRSLAHDSKPVIWIGQHGLTANVLEEVNSALDHHELVKIKLRVGDREDREKVIVDICEKTSAELIKKIGNTATVFRRNEEEPVIKFPKK